MQWNAASLDWVTTILPTVDCGFAAIHAETFSPRFARSANIVAENTFTALNDRPGRKTSSLAPNGVIPHLSRESAAARSVCNSSQPNTDSGTMKWVCQA